jgi:hypothetical protein
VEAVTNPVWEPGRDKDEQYREHVVASLQASPWAWVIKVSDITDNAVGLFYTTGPKLPRLAAKYRPLLAPLRELVLRGDTPLDTDVKDMIPGSSPALGRGSPRSADNGELDRTGSIAFTAFVLAPDSRQCERASHHEPVRENDFDPPSSRQATVS